MSNGLVNRDQIGHLNAANGALQCSVIFYPTVGHKFVNDS